MIIEPKPALQTSVSTQEKPCFLGVDVGGTSIKVGLVDNCGHTLANSSIDTRANEKAQRAIERSAEACRQLARQADVAWADIAAAGLGTPGPMSLADGCLLDPGNLPAWHNFYARQALQEVLEKPVSFINDANAAALGEAWIGAGAGHSSLAMFTLGTGVGGGLISEGRLIHGVNSFGSELGHTIVDSRPDARLCVWGGGRGQLEAFASASAVAAQAQLRVKSGAESILGRAGKSDTSDAITAKDVYRAALDGDALAIELIDETAFYLGVGVTTAVHMIDPGLVLLGGAMDFGGSSCPIGRRFLQGVVDEFKRRTFDNVFAGTKIEFAKLGGDAGYIGAAAYARQEFQGN